MCDERARGEGLDYLQTHIVVLLFACVGLEALCPGKKVNVKWLGQCFEGTVVSLGPQRKLCKVQNPITPGSVLVACRETVLTPRVSGGRLNHRRSCVDGPFSVEAHRSESSHASTVKHWSTSGLL